MATNPKFTDVSQAVGTDFDNADGTSLKGILTGGANGTRIESISIATDEAGANDLMLFIDDTSTDHPVGHIDIPANSGTDGSTEAVSGFVNLSWLLVDVNGNKYINIPAGFRLKAKMRVTVTATETVNVVVFASDY
jgi:hypothetical protein